MDYRIQKGQEKRLIRAYRARRGCKLILHHRQCTGDCCVNGRLSLSPTQHKRLLAASASSSSNDGDGGGSAQKHRGIQVPFTPEDFHRNETVSGGFIPLILAAIASSVAGGLIERGIARAGLIWKHTQGACRLKPNVGGAGLHLIPYRGRFLPQSTPGLYVQSRSRGRGGTPRPASSEDVKKMSPAHKKILKELVRQAIRE